MKIVIHYIIKYYITDKIYCQLHILQLNYFVTELQGANKFPDYQILSLLLKKTMLKYIIL